MYIRYIGHSCFSLEGSRTVLIDPMPEEARKIPADLVLVTHGHSDHLGITAELGKRTIAIHELARYLRSLGVDAAGMNIGGTAEADGILVHMVPAVHSSSADDGDRYMGAAAGFVVEMDGLSVYHAGDTALFSDMKLIYELYHPDVALLPAGGLFTMDPAQAMIAAEWIGAPLVIPMHYNTFPAIGQDLTEFKRAVEVTGQMKAELLHPGSGIEVAGTT
jgi:L-ascorbate metabolism protein UlaG (beta-lactamase superfamily)